jgi:hypothetical protein
MTIYQKLAVWLRARDLGEALVREKQKAIDDLKIQAFTEGFESCRQHWEAHNLKLIAERDYYRAVIAQLLDQTQPAQTKAERARIH